MDPVTMISRVVRSRSMKSTRCAVRSEGSGAGAATSPLAAMRNSVAPVRGSTRSISPANAPPPPRGYVDGDRPYLRSEPHDRQNAAFRAYNEAHLFGSAASIGLDTNGYDGVLPRLDDMGQRDHRPRRTRRPERRRGRRERWRRSRRRCGSSGWVDGCRRWREHKRARVGAEALSQKGGRVVGERRTSGRGSGGRRARGQQPDSTNCGYD